MPNLRGMRPVSQDDGSRSYAARANNKSRPSLAMSWVRGILRARQCNSDRGAASSGRTSIGLGSAERGPVGCGRPGLGNNRRGAGG